MVSFVNTLLAAVVAVVAVSPSQAIKIGEYFRPASGDFSGFPGTNATFRRAPCPALNALANHGVLPRNGQNITKAVLREAIMGVYNLDNDAAQTLLNLVPDNFSLDYLGAHNVVEHDASLVHRDLYFGQDPAEIDLALAADLFSHADSSGNFGPTELAAVRKARLVNSASTNPQVVFGSTQQTLAYTEAAIFLLGFGGKQNETVSADVIRSFVLEERIPTTWNRSATPITVAEVRATVANIIAATV
ncbi:hypothetical protein Gpo141_00011483 [Globisporangium polare]